MSETVHCDIAIIGAGSGGLSVAAVAAQLGLKVVLIEANKMGGDCLNTGCVPSKALIAAAKSAHEFIHAEKFGLEANAPKVHFSKVLAHVKGVINAIAPNDSYERFTALGAHVIKAHAKFIDKNTILAGDTKITARRFVIATGSSPAIPPIPGLKELDFYTNETIFDLQEKPSHLIVIGAGPIGCELAQAFLFLGIKVTVLEAFTMMPRDEADLVDVLRNELVSQGLALHEQVKVLEVKKTSNNIEIIIEKNGNKEIITGSHLLVATGRKANVDKLDLEKANIEFTPKGINVDQYLRTTNKKIYAIGDVIGPYQFTHIAGYHAGIVIRNVIFKGRAKVDYTSIPWVTYTSPELAHTGLIAEEAIKLDPKVKVFSVDFSHNDRAQAEHATNGKIKIVTTAKGKVLGASILAENAGDLILPWIMLIKEKQTLRYLTDTIIPYPNLSDIHKRVASEFYKPILFSKNVKRLVNFLKYF